MTVKVEQDPARELPPSAGAGAEEFSPQLSSGEEEEDYGDEDEETDSEGDDGAGNGGGAPPLRKGPWTPDEDKRLADYVVAHGEGNWNQVQRNARLNRCGKSCRLRWANHLRPDLKKGPFDAEEVDKIIRLHIMWGNKWAKMATQLPGRTDNEIKNFWNTRLKRHQRAGLPIYPEYLLSRVSDRDMNCHTPDESHGKKRSNELPQEKVLGMDDLMGDFMVFQHLDYGKDPVVPTNPLKRHASTGDLSCLQILDKTEKTYSNDLNYALMKSQSVPLGSAIASGYPVFDGNPSTSGTIHRTMKTELPSFQCSSYYDYSSGWLLQSHPASPIERQIDTSIQSPESISSQNTGLLGSIVDKVDVLDDPTKSSDVMVPLGYDLVSQYAYPMRHPSSSIIGDCEPKACLFPEFHGSNSSSGDAGVPGTSLEASFLNDDLLLLKGHSYLYPSNPIFNEDFCEEPKPLTDASQWLTDAGQWLTDAGQWLDSSAWKSVPGAYNKPNSPSL